MALEVTKPNIRKMFVPPRGFTIVEIDIKQGDAQIVAWESQAKKLMETFEAQRRGDLINGLPIDVHSRNALIVSPDLPLNKKGRVPDNIRQVYKVGVHATNYGVSPYSLAHKLGLTVAQTKTFQNRWFGANPEIPKWHESVEHEVMTTRSVTNVLGYRRFFMGRIDDVLPEALAWKPQSTVALVINAGIRKVGRRLPFVQRLLQVHDSAIYQFRNRYFTRTLVDAITECHLITLPYPRPLVMTTDIKWSQTSWGEATDEFPW
jgi:DNA polymerase-1